MRRRSVLLGVGALAASAGCSRLFRDDPVEVRVMRPEDDTDATACGLSESFVRDHAVLERVLESATTAPEGEWVVADTDRQTARQLLDDLRAHCGEATGVYRFADTRYRLRVQTSDGTPLGSASASSEAIRSARAEESP